jgi:hypothetical protein
MHEEYKTQAQQCGLTCYIWENDGNIANASQLLLVAVENVPVLICKPILGPLLV